jgi:ABC-2 type transport system permease protein
MKKILVVAKWEYLEKVKSKAFLIGLFVTPLLMVGMAILPTFFARQEDQSTKVIGVIDQTGALTVGFAHSMEGRYTLSNGAPNYRVLNLASGPGINLDDEMRAANRKVAADELEGYCVFRSSVFQDTLVEYRSKVVGDFRMPARIAENLRDLIVAHRSAALGIDAKVLDQLKVNLDVQTVKLSKAGEEEEGGGFERVFLSSYVFLLMLLFLIMTSGQLLVRSVIEEKSNRIVEILVSSCSPTELMAGKVLGLSGLGLTQMAFWALIGVVVTVQTGMNLIDPLYALLLALYFVLGYLFYAAVFIAAGSPLTTEQEAQQVTSYLVMFLILPIVLALPAMKNPEALWLKVLTYFPPLTPTMMALRIPIQVPSVWEILGTVLLMVVSIYLAMVAAGRIFRIAILSTGKTPTLAEIMRWVRKG